MERVLQYVNAIEMLVENVEMVAVRTRLLKELVAHFYSRVLQIEGSITPSIQITYDVEGDNHNNLLQFM